MAYAHVSEACGVTLEGSTPSPRTMSYADKFHAYSGLINFMTFLISIQ